ncbi:zinc ribbon domain-containing protein [Halorubrum ezzemoulense]|uniref:zinc ribbon domain-containing protein n=1 Tax=Halorubrum ezzemoulense TaxID=337243 RepID=UPI0015C677C9|nr:zinc ribbon domain-containing protein [Halorubrum ezzemoulense]
MKLSRRREIRGWLLNRPDGTLFWAILGAFGVGVLGLVTGADAVFAGGFLAGLAGIYVGSEVPYDACPTCRSKVDAVSERYCATCGARLDELEAAPPIDERVPERFRPFGLEEIERSPDIETIADGGSYEEADA